MAGDDTKQNAEKDSSAANADSTESNERLAATARTSSAGTIDSIATAVKAAAAADPDAPNDRDLADLDWNDFGNGQRLVGRHGQDLIFVDEAGWFYWNGQRWRPPPAKRSPEAQRLAHQTVKAMQGEILALQAELDDDIASGRLNPNYMDYANSIKNAREKISAFRRFARVSGNSSRITAMLKEAEPYLPRSQAALDSNSYLFNTSNGTLVLGAACSDGTVNVKLQPHDRRDFMTRLSPVVFDPDAVAPRFREFIEQILPNPEIRKFIQVWFGYCLSGDVSEQRMVLFHGTGANGKSTLLKIVSTVLGDYAVSMPIQTFLVDKRRGGGDATPDLVRMVGARLVAASEPERGSRLSESVVKTVTGGERVVARRLFEGQFEFDPCFKLVLSANEKPQISGQDEGIWRRVILVPFEAFIESHKRNRKLFDELMGELPGILNWLLDGYRLWRERGLEIPAVLTQATDKYRAESDPIGDFLQSCTRPAEHAQIRAKDLYGAYELWCKNNASDPISSNMFGRRLSDRGVDRQTKQVVYYALAFTDQGLKLLDELHRRSSKKDGDGGTAD